MNIGRAIITGNLVKQPELRQTQSETEVAEFTVAVNSREKQNGVWVDYASFFDVVAFGHNATFVAQHGAKGSPVAVDGRLKQERWEKDGQKRSRVRIIASNIQLLPRANREGGESDAYVPSGEFTVPDANFDVPAADDDVPF